MRKENGIPERSWTSALRVYRIQAIARLTRLLILVCLTLLLRSRPTLARSERSSLVVLLESAWPLAPVDFDFPDDLLLEGDLFELELELELESPVLLELLVGDEDFPLFFPISERNCLLRVPLFLLEELFDFELRLFEPPFFPISER